MCHKVHLGRCVPARRQATGTTLTPSLARRQSLITVPSLNTRIRVGYPFQIYFLHTFFNSGYPNATACRERDASYKGQGWSTLILDTKHTYNFQSDVSDYATATDAESSDAATGIILYSQWEKVDLRNNLDESWVKTPAKKKGEHFLRTPTSRGGSNSRRFHDTPKTTLSKATSSTTLSRSGKPYGKQLDRTPQSGTYFWRSK